ncbi:MAG TPA: branched-chain amino acid ABC transporter ATP-binding protein/permease [Accumulibacter sp.]|nr:branched-chain amino acid ABC transporter ATP-binding protein/permease [Accumulibacter sp.]HMW17624.1 branched-chain amino acid ABC transporter ATP-binding protein/permease [Accumulibacter sp.]HMX21742.1 branched-chain amino acid ABC transporter ATP-binding protein/permease [Accumulibacter sp.]HMY05512.1 branched-chain amino acid ABC transporter ATP-binding protein/permease [Accumulibacter sp.]HNC18305.1 branched-chain amino acid ABC transporter ATP-binding protein/permease [Accumulibacter s
MKRLRRFLPPLLLAALAAAPWLLSEFHITLLNYIGLYALVALGLVILTGVGGVSSFGQAAFVGLGAYTSAYLTTVHGLSPWLTLPIGLALTMVVALTLGLVTLRLSGHFLPLGTIAWGISLYFLFGNLDALGGHTGIGGLPPLPLAGYELKSGQDYFYLIWLALLLAVFATRNLLDSREGRAIRALKGGSVMADAMGVHTPRAKIVVFTLAALLASLSGWLYAHLQRFVNPTPFSLTQGIEYLFMAVVGGVSHVWGAIVGAGLITLLKQGLQDWLPRLFGQSGNFEMIVFGVLMIVVLQRARDGVWPVLQRIFPPPAVRIPAGDVESLSRRPRPAAGEVLLDVKKATKYFGGLCANDQISFDVRAGEVMALIGPNGAGKSTLFDGISGVEPLTGGAVHFRGEAVEKLPAREIARRGLSRTFQHVRLLPAMSVLENVAIGAHLRGRQGLFAAACRRDRVEEARLLREAARQLERCGLAEHFASPAGSLPLGKQRLVEIARALAADPCLLLLDEPAAGLRYLEKQALDELLRRLRDEGIGILLVEHDMDFVMGLADRVVVIEFGRKLAAGRPDEIQRHPAVVQAYLGGVE